MSSEAECEYWKARALAAEKMAEKLKRDCCCEFATQENPNLGAKLSVSELARRADVDFRTAARWLRSQKVRPSCAARLVAAMAKFEMDSIAEK